MTRTRAKTDPFWATALHRMEPGSQRIVRGLYALVQRSPILRSLWFGSGWRSNSKEHKSGRAIDVIVTENAGMRPTPAEHKAAMEFINWLIANHRALGIQWVLYSTDGKNRTQSWNADRGTWKNLANRGSISANHIDHVHIYFKPGAVWPRALNNTVVGATTSPAPKPTPGLPSTGVSTKTVAQLAQEVLDGKHGNGDARRHSLGDRYAAVQAEVNRILAGNRPTPTPTPATVATLKQGSRGDRVRRLQQGLRRTFPAYRHHVAPKGRLLAVDGIFGAHTERWVREFQRRSKLADDGIVGPRTLRELNRHGIRP